MLETPNDHNPGFVVVERDHYSACFDSSVQAIPTISQSRARCSADCALVDGIIRVRDDLAVEIKGDLLSIQRGPVEEEVFPGEIRHLVSISVLRIDEAMVQQAVQQATEIGVLATVRSTLEPTLTLIKEKALMEGKEIHIHHSLCKGAFEALTAGDRERHDQLVLQSARAFSTEAEVIVLAQTSMARLQSGVPAETGLPVFSSVRSGIEQVKRILQTL